MLDTLVEAVVNAIVPVGGAIAVLLFAGLAYQTWMLSIERRYREQDRQQAIIEARDRGQAMTKLALANDGMAQALGRIEASLSVIATAISRVDGAMSRSR